MAYAKAGATGTNGPPLLNVLQLQALLTDARRQNCLSIVAEPLRSDPLCPQGVREELDRIQALNWGVYAATAASIGPVLAQAAQEGIAVVVYKGAAQAERHYAQPSARSMADVDLLVRQDQNDRLYDILALRGFRRRFTPGRTVTSRFSHERSYTPPTPGARALDIHTFPTSPARYPLPVTEMIARAVPGELFEAPVRFLVPEDEFLVMAVNQAHDHFRMGFLRYLDAWLISTRCDIDWRLVADRAIAVGAATATWQTLSNARRVAGLKVPAAVLDLLQPSSLRRAWLGALLDNTGLGDPRISLPRRFEQLLLLYPVIDRPDAFARFLAVHTGLRILDASQRLVRNLRRTRPSA